MTLLLLFRPHRYGGNVKGYATTSDVAADGASASDVAARSASASDTIHFGARASNA